MSLKRAILGPSRPTLSQVENAFQPAKEITDAERFAGRRQSVVDSYYALIAVGANIAIVGNRGIGKTSLATQLIKLGGGDLTLLRRLGVGDEHKPDFLAIYFACGKHTRSTPELLQSLLTSHNCLAEWVYDIPKAQKTVESLSPKLTAKINAVVAEIGSEVGGATSTEITRDHLQIEANIEVIFSNVVSAITNEGLARDGLLIVIDEFDQIHDPSGFASFLKSLATNAPKVKFCIVGVAKDLQALIKEHESADRLFAGGIISLPSMQVDELKEIVEIAERAIDQHIVFDASAKSKLATLAQGHPYMVHLVGKYALRSAFQQDIRVVDDKYIDATLQAIADRGADPVLEGRYRKAVQSSQHREIVLHALAGNQDEHGEIWTTNAYRSALDQGVENSSQYVGQLVTEAFGAELENIRERFYRFKDSLFAAYVRARPMLHKVNPTTSTETFQMDFTSGGNQIKS